MKKIKERKNTNPEKPGKDNKEDRININLHKSPRLLLLQRMATLGKLTGGVIHELNNPIGFVSSNLISLREYLQDLTTLLDLSERIVSAGEKGNSSRLQSVSKEYREKSEEVGLDFILDDLDNLISESIEGIERLNGMITSLKKFTCPREKEWIFSDINRIMDEALEISWNELKYHTTVNKHYGEIPEVPCYPRHLTQAFINLLINAATAIQEEGTITIITYQDNNYISVEISDTGTGISPPNLPGIFEPFSTTRENPLNAGLGLSAAYQIVNGKHGGDILVDSEPGGGSTFTVKIPLKLTAGL